MPNTLLPPGEEFAARRRAAKRRNERHLGENEHSGLRDSDSNESTTYDRHHGDDQKSNVERLDSVKGHLYAGQDIGADEDRKHRKQNEHPTRTLHHSGALVSRGAGVGRALKNAPTEHRNDHHDDHHDDQRAREAQLDNPSNSPKEPITAEHVHVPEVTRT